MQYFVDRIHFIDDIHRVKMFSQRKDRVVLCFVYIFSFVDLIQAQNFGSSQGPECQTNSGKSGICQEFNDCQNIEALFNEGGNPKICGYRNGESIICCPHLSTVSKSEERCEYYKSIRCTEDKSVPTIINGEKVTSVQEFPHQVHLGFGNVNNADYTCGGTLISEQWVLTAAHCLRRGSPTVADMGFLNTQNRNEFGTHQRIKIVQTVKHPNRGSLTYDDIALLKLERPVRLNANVVPACLHNSTHIGTKQATATGWGKTDAEVETQSPDLMKVKIKLVDHNTCARNFKPERRMPQGIKEESQFCAGHDNKDTCQGDSGGPLQITHSNLCTHSIIGITSVGAKCGIKPGIYTRVSHYVPWIESVVWPN